jgi:hypothetical protein
MITPITTYYAGVIYEPEALTYFNKLGTPIADAAKVQINDLIVTMKRLNIWNNCTQGWLFLPEHSGVPAGATAGTFYDLKGEVNLNMSGFAEAGQTQTTKGPHIFVDATRTKYAVLSGTYPVAGVFGDTNYGNGEPLGCVAGIYIDEPESWSSEGLAINSIAPGFHIGVQEQTYPDGASNGHIFQLTTGGSGNSIAPTFQFYSRQFQAQFPSTRGVRTGFISNQGVIHEQPIFFASDPTATFTFWSLNADNTLGGNTSHGNVLSAYIYMAFSTLSPAFSATVPRTRTFNRGNQPAGVTECGNYTTQRSVYNPTTDTPFQGFGLNNTVPATITSPNLIILANRNAGTAVNTNGGNPMFLFFFSKKTNFGFRGTNNLVEFNMQLRKLCGSRMLPMISPLDRGRMRLSRNLTDTQIPPPLIYVGLSGTNGSDMLTLYGNNPVSAQAGSLSAFNIELWCENDDYGLFPSTATNMTSASYNGFLNYMQYRLHDGFSLANTSMVFPLCAFVPGAGQTVTRSIGGYLTKTYRKLCTATVAPTAACIIRNHSTAYSYLSDFEVLVTDFSFSYVP